MHEQVFPVFIEPLLQHGENPKLVTLFTLTACTDASDALFNYSKYFLLFINENKQDVGNVLTQFLDAAQHLFNKIRVMLGAQVQVLADHGENLDE